MPERQRRSGSARDSLMPMGSPAFDPVVQARARVGQTLNGKWTLDGLLGVGGMAVVYAATHRNRKRAAIKMLHPTLSALPDMRERFLREGYVANSVGHEGVVRVDDDDVTEDGTAYIVMELLEGEAIDFRADRKGGLLDAVEVLSIADQVLDVLVSAHEAGVIHRDLKPDNLFLHKNGQLKLLDFGIARLKEVNAPDTTTRTGSLMGTPAFMAPEQARGRWNDVDARTDLWAVGAIMFTLLTGRHVHDAETANEALALAITKPAPKIGSLHPAIPGSVANVVDKALSYDKGDRYQDARSMQAAVQQAYQDVMASSRMHVKSSVRPPALSMVDVAPMLTRDSISTDSQTIASHPATSTLTSWISIVDGAHRQESSAKRRGIWWLAAAAVALLGWGAFSTFAQDASPQPDHAQAPATPEVDEPPSQIQVTPVLAEQPAASGDAPMEAPAASATQETKPPSAPKATSPKRKLSSSKPPTKTKTSPPKPATKEVAKPAPKDPFDRRR